MWKVRKYIRQHKIVAKMWWKERKKRNEIICCIKKSLFDVLFVKWYKWIKNFGLFFDFINLTMIQHMNVSLLNSSKRIHVKFLMIIICMFDENVSTNCRLYSKKICSPFIFIQ